MSVDMPKNDRVLYLLLFFLFLLFPVINIIGVYGVVKPLGDTLLKLSD